MTAALDADLARRSAQPHRRSARAARQYARTVIRPGMPYSGTRREG